MYTPDDRAAGTGNNNKQTNKKKGGGEGTLPESVLVCHTFHDLRTSVYGKPIDLSHSSPCSLGVHGTEANNLTALLR